MAYPQGRTVVETNCALCGNPPSGARWSRGDAFCHGCKHFVCFDCHIKGPGVIPSGPHTLELHKKKGERVDLHAERPKPSTVNVTEQKGLDEMPIIATAGSSKSYTPAPAGLHNGVCVDVVDLGFEPNKFYDPSKPGSKKELQKIRIIWEIPAINPDTGERHTVAQKYTLSINEKSNLGPVLVKWRGRPFTEGEAKAFDVEKVVGAPCSIGVIHNVEPGGVVYANVESVSPFVAEFKVDDQIIKRTPLKPSATYVRVKDRPPKDAPLVNPSAPANADVPF